MAFKINISEKGKTFKLESDSEELIGKKIGDKIDGRELKKELEGYQLEITGTSDIAGFPGNKDIDSSGLKRLLLKKGKFMKTSRPKGLRLKKTVRGSIISKDIVQINTKILKVGNKKLEEAFPEQIKVGKSKRTGLASEEKEKSEERKEEGEVSEKAGEKLTEQKEEKKVDGEKAEKKEEEKK